MSPGLHAGRGCAPRKRLAGPRCFSVLAVLLPALFLPSPALAEQGFTSASLWPTRWLSAAAFRVDTGAGAPIDSARRLDPGEHDARVVALARAHLLEAP